MIYFRLCWTTVDEQQKLLMLKVIFNGINGLEFNGNRFLFCQGYTTESLSLYATMLNMKNF